MNKKENTTALFSAPHWMLIAKTLRFCKPDNPIDFEVWQKVCVETSAMFAKDNAHFVRARFFVSCGLSHKGGKPNGNA